MSIASEPVSSAWFGARSGASDISKNASLIEVLVPENQLSKVHPNKLNSTWFEINEPIAGSIIQEFKGEGLSQKNLKKIIKDIKASADIEYSLDHINSIIQRKNRKIESQAGINEWDSDLKKKSILKSKKIKLEPEITEHPSVAYIKKVKISNFEEKQLISSQLPIARKTICQPNNLDLFTTKAIKSMSLISDLMSFLVPELNPYAPNEIGVDCNDAQKKLNTIFCQWKNKINPFDSSIVCTKAISFVKLNTKGKSSKFEKSEQTPACKLIYRLVTIKASEKLENYLKENQYFSNKGVLDLKSDSLLEWLNKLKYEYSIDSKKSIKEQILEFPEQDAQDILQNNFSILLQFQKFLA